MMGSGHWVYPRGLIDPPSEIEQPRAPLRLYERGMWDPAEQYWGESDGLLEVCLVEVIAAGPRLQFEFEQALPGGEDPDARDAIECAIAGTPIVPMRCSRAWSNGMRAASTRTRTLSRTANEGGPGGSGKRPGI
jgi:hypothetical protein